MTLPDQDDVPDQLLDRDQWVAWLYQCRNCWEEHSERADECHSCGEDRVTKVPINPATGKNAKANDPDTWDKFDAAVTYSETNDYAQGVGFMFSEEDIFVGIDLDACRDPDTGQFEEWAVDIIKTIDSYTEISPSGYGVHIIAIGFKPDGRNRKGQTNDIVNLQGTDKGPEVEMYDNGRFFTFTGDTRDLLPTELRQANNSVKEVWKKYIRKSNSEKRLEEQFSDDDEKDSSVDIPSDDQILLDKARNAENGEKFTDLYDNGNWRPYAHEWEAPASADDARSEADFALATMLAFWTREDKHRMERLFDASALAQRSKWKDRADYRDRTLTAAIKKNDTVYDPNYHDDDPDAEEIEDITDEEVSTDRGGDDVLAKFIDGCRAYNIETHNIATRSDGENEWDISVDDIINPGDTVPDGILSFNREANNLTGKDKQAVIGRVIYLSLLDQGEFFKTTDKRLFYFHEEELEVKRVDGQGKRTFDEEFQEWVWFRYKLHAGKFSRNLGKDLKATISQKAPEREVYQFAHYDENKCELYVTDWDSGYYAIDEEKVEWRPNGTDLFFIPNHRAESYKYIDPDDRVDLPDEVPGEMDMWAGSGDPVMRVLANRVNFSDQAALTPIQQRQQLYLHLHTLPFISQLNSRPIMAWVGEKGSGKTVVERSIGKFVYGPDYVESTMPDSKDDFIAKVSNQALAFVDNYDDGEDWANDILAAVATGAGVDMRELYTTNDLHQVQPRCWLSMTSRDPPFRRDDVADRTLVFRVDRIEDGFIGTKDYLRQVTAYRDLLWSTYLDNLQQVLQEYHTVDTGSMSSQHRMADWAIFAKLIADGLGVSAVDELLEMMETERATFALENEPWAALIGHWVRSYPEDAAEWRKASSMVDRLQEISERDDRPFGLATASGLGSKLSMYQGELAELYDLEVDESGRTYKYRFAVDEGATPTGLDRY